MEYKLGDNAHDSESALQVCNLPDLVVQAGNRPGFFPSRHVANSLAASDQSGECFAGYRTTVTERLYKRQKAFHDKCTHEMFAKLNEAGQHFNARIDELLNDISFKVSNTETALEQQLSKLRQGYILAQQNEASLWCTRTLIQKHQLELRIAIENAEERVLANEQAKTDQIAEIVDQCNKQLQVRSHMLPKEVQAYIEHETLNMNQVLLLNRRCLVQLFQRLLTHSIQKQKCFDGQWKVYYQQWRISMFNQLADRLLEHQQQIKRPASVVSMLAQLYEQQLRLNAERASLLHNAMSPLLPPTITESIRTTWATIFAHKCNEIVQESQKISRQISKEYEAVQDECVNNLVTMRQSLIDKNVVKSEEELSEDPFKISMYKCIVAVSHMQRKLEAEMLLVEKADEANTLRIQAMLGSLMAKVNGVSSIWFNHVQSSQSLEQQLEKALRQLRQTHQKNIDLKQTHLEMSVDRMRQAASTRLVAREFELTSFYVKELSEIQRELARQYSDVILHYPVAFEQLLTTYFLQLCDYFHVVPDIESRTEQRTGEASIVSEYCLLRTGIELSALRQEYQRQNNAANGHQAANAQGIKNTPPVLPVLVVPVLVNTADDGEAAAARELTSQHSFEAKLAALCGSLLVDATDKLTEPITLPSQALVCGRLKRMFGLEVPEQIKLGTLYAPHRNVFDVAGDGQQHFQSSTTQVQVTDFDITSSITRGDGNQCAVQFSNASQAYDAALERIPAVVEATMTTANGHRFFLLSTKLPERNIATESPVSMELVMFEHIGSRRNVTTDEEKSKAVTEEKELENVRLDKIVGKESEVSVLKSPNSLHCLARAAALSSAEVVVEAAFQEAVTRVSCFFEQFQAEAENMVISLRDGYLTHYVDDWRERGRLNATATAKLKEQNITKQCDFQVNALAQQRLVIQREVRDNRLHELRVHDERVNRYVLNICRSTTRINAEYEKLSAQQQQTYEQYRRKMAEIEQQLATVENIARLEHAHQLGIGCNERYLREFAELRETFSKNTSAYVGQIRQSNEKFLQTMRLFADGGTYCADEIAEYERRLNKLTTKAETSIASILQETDAIAQRRQQSAVAVLKMFQERMIENQFDLLMIEKIAKQMSRVQLKIKIEASKSNHMHREIGEQLAAFEALQDTILDDFVVLDEKKSEAEESKNNNNFSSDSAFIERLYSDASTATTTVGIDDSGKAIVAPKTTENNKAGDALLLARQRQKMLHNSEARQHVGEIRIELANSYSNSFIIAAKPSSASIHRSTPIALQTERLMHCARSTLAKLNRRGLYLDCVKHRKLVQNSRKQQSQAENYKQAADAESFNATTLDVAAANNGAGQVRLAAVADEHDDHEHRQHRGVGAAQATPAESGNSNGFTRKIVCKSEISDDAANDLLMGIMHGIEVQVPKCSGAESPTMNFSSMNASKSSPPPQPSENASKAVVERSVNVDSSQNSTPTTEENANSPDSSGPATAEANNSEETKKKKIPRTQRFLVFGEQPPKKVSSSSANDVPFVDSVNILLWEALDSLLHSTDEFYRRKGNRAISRPDVVPDQFEACAQMLTQRLLSYQQQALKYYEKSIFEYATQLHQFEASLVTVPDIILHKISNDFITELHARHDEMRAEFLKQILVWDNVRQQHQQLLHPDLGHPRHQEAFVRVAENELNRHDALCMLAQHYQEAVGTLVQQSAASFVRTLLDSCRGLWRLFDGVIIVDDVVVGNAAKRAVGTAGNNQAAATVASELVLPRELFRFDDEPLGERLVSRKSKKWSPLKNLVEASDTIMSLKTTLGHLATETSVLRYHKTFELQKQLCKAANDATFSKLLESERKWTTYWCDSMAKIRGIYDDDTTV